MTERKFEPSTFEEEMLEAIQILGKEKWNTLTREEKIKETKRLKKEGYIGYFDATEYWNGVSADY